MKYFAIVFAFAVGLAFGLQTIIVMNKTVVGQEDIENCLTQGGDFYANGKIGVWCQLPAKRIKY